MVKKLFITAVFIFFSTCIFGAAQLQNLQVIGGSYVPGSDITVQFEAAAGTANNWINTDVVFSADNIREYTDDAVQTSAGTYDANFSPPDNDGHTGYYILQPADTAFYVIPVVVKVPAGYSGQYYVFVAAREGADVTLTSGEDTKDAVLFVTLDAATPTPTFTITETETETNTNTPSYTDTPSPSATASVSPSGTYTNTPTYTDSPTGTGTDTPTDTPSPTYTDTKTATETDTATSTCTDTGTSTDTETATDTHTATPTATDSPPSTATDTATVTGTYTITPTGTYTSTPSGTYTATPTSTDSPQDTQTNTPSVTRTFTSTPSVTPSFTDTASPTFSRTLTPTPTFSNTPSNTPTVTETGTITETHTISPTFTDSPAGTLTFTPTRTPISAGEGTAIINPTTAGAGTSGNTMAITYTNGPNLWGNGLLKVMIPAGWSAPSLVATDPGYYTVSVSGGTYAGTIKSGQIITVYCNNLTANTGTITVTYGSKISGGPGAAAQAGTGTATFTVEMNPVGGTTLPIAASPQVNVTVPTPTATITRTFTPTPTVTKTYTGTPSVTPTNTPQTGEGTASVAPGTVMAAGTGNTLVFDYTAGPTAWAAFPGYGTLRITIPAGWSLPSTTSSAAGYFTVDCKGGTINGFSASGNDIIVYVYGLPANTGKIIIRYGDKTGVPAGPGAIAQPGAGIVEFTLKTIPNGTAPDKIANPPQVSVAAATATATATTTPTFTATPDITPGKPQNFSITQSGNNSTLRWNTGTLTDSYVVYRATGASGKFMAFPPAWTIIATVLPTPATSSYTDNNSFDYVFYLVTAKNAAGEGNPCPIGEKLNLNFLFTPGGPNTYRVSLPYVSLYAKASDLVLAVEGSLTSAPSKMDKLALWNPANQNFSLFGWQAGIGAWIGTDWPIDAGTLSSNAVYVHALSNFAWPLSGISRSQGLYFKYNTTKANANKRSLPYSSNYHKASDVVIDIEGGTGPGTNTKISRVAVWNTATQSYTAFGYAAGSGWIIGTDFNINPGDALNIYPSGNLSEFTWTPKISITPVP